MTSSTQNKSSRNELINAKVQMIDAKQEDIKSFAITVVFNASGERPNPDYWMQQYKRVLMKINKKLSRHSVDCRSLLKAPKGLSLRQRNAIVKENHRKLSERSQKSVLKELETVYEFDEYSKFRFTRDTCKPHHIHGVIGIPDQLVPRIWDANRSCLVSRLQRDLNSMDIVSNLLIEPLNYGKTINWIGYIFKQKEVI